MGSLDISSQIAQRAETNALDTQFNSIWETNQLTPVSPQYLAGIEALRQQREHPTDHISTVGMTEVTLRDGQQQRTDPVSVEQRLDVFDSIVQTGNDRIEIGHLANPTDQEFATAVIRHVAELEESDERYSAVKLQVMFGTQEDLILSGSAVLQEAFRSTYGDTWEEEMARRTVVHIYDRVDTALSDTNGALKVDETGVLGEAERNAPYDQKEAARRTCVAAQHALKAGFRHFSISGEAATATTPDEAIQFYRTVAQHLADEGADTVNINLANTYGYSANELWNTDTLAIFNTAVKHGFKPDQITTSVHAHDDVDNATDFSLKAVVAGFDRVEGTLIGMGERPGNTGTLDVIARLVEAARHQVEAVNRPKESLVAMAAGPTVLKRTVRLAQGLIDNIGNNWEAANRIAAVFGEHAEYRWKRSAMGNPYIFDNGSGPHDQKLAAAVANPQRYPVWRGYGWGVTHASLIGNPMADRLAIGDPEAAREITVANHAGGGKTQMLASGKIRRAAPEIVAAAQQEFEDYKTQAVGALASGTVLVA